ncbi:MAG TPA: hypothetical protein VFD58_35210 [Blastocatellia bacterium]|nr:hypothetical protein [Blastocatellia bacterium]
MKRARRQFVEGLLLTSAMPLVASAGGESRDSSAGRKDQPQPVVLRGRVVCLTEELGRRYGVQPECETRGHVYALKTADQKLYPFLPTDQAAAIYDDRRFRERDLQVTARLLPDASFIEVIKLQSARAGGLYDLYYFCEVCNIRTHKPGPCECCQDPVVFHEDPAEEEPKVAPPGR